MRSTEVLLDRYDQVAQLVTAVLDGTETGLLTARVSPHANTIAWLVWHSSRVQDDHVAEVAGRDQVWTTGGWARRFALPFDDAETGYGFTTEQVGQVRASAEDLAAYHAAVHEATTAWVRGLSDDDLDRVVDERWDPPVTLGVRLGSVIGDDLQHLGQAAFLRSVLEELGARESL